MSHATTDQAIAARARQVDSIFSLREIARKREQEREQERDEYAILTHETTTESEEP